MSGSVPVYRPQERIRSQPLVDASTGEGGAMAALSRSMGDLQNTIAAAGRDMQQAREERRFGEARRDALTAPIRDEQGNYTVPDPDFTTRTGRMSAETLLGRIIDEETIGARERAIQMRANVGGDPERFSAQWRADSDQRINMLPAWVRERAGQVFRQIGVEHVSAQRMEVVRRDQRLTEAGWRDVLTATHEDLEGLARAGQIQSEEFATANQRLIEHLDRGVREGFISPETRRTTLDTVAERAGSQAVFRAVLDRLEAGESPEAVTRALEDDADRRAIPPGARNNLRSMLRTAVNERSARQAFQRSELRGEIEEWTRISTSGLVPFDPVRGDALIRRAEALGDAQLATALRRQQRAFVDVASVATVSLPDIRRRQAEALAELQQAPDDAERALRFDRLRALQTVERQRREQMEADPFGTAVRIHRGKPGIGELGTLDFANLERLGMQLVERRRQAGILAGVEGLSQTSMPVLTTGEAEMFRRVLSDPGGASPDQQLALLRAMTPLGADTMAATLSSILPGRNDDATPRVQAFVAAGSVAQRGRWDVARRVLEGMERMRVMGGTAPPALAGPEAARVVEERTGVAYQFVHPAAVAAAQTAVRAAYVSLVARADILPGDRMSDVNAPALTGRLDRTALLRAIDEIMPTVEFNGRRVAAPRGLSQAEFDDEINRIGWTALRGVRAASGQPVQPWMVRRFGDLTAVGQDRYILTISNFRPRGPGGEPFFLDMSRSFVGDGPQLGPNAINPAGLPQPVASAIATAATRHRVPPDLAQRVAMQESGGRQRRADGSLVRSTAGAIGVMQLMPGTARGLGVDAEDEAQNIDGGVRYLAQMLERFGDPVLATAAYNWGPERVRRWRDRGSSAEQLPAETRNYLERIWGRPIEDLFPPRFPRRMMGPAASVRPIPGWDEAAQ